MSHEAIQKRSDSEQAGASTDQASPSARSVQLRAALAGKGYDEQAAMLSPVQAKAGGLGGDVHSAAAHGIQGAGGQMPHFDAVQQAFGKHDISGVQSHVGGNAAEATKSMGAEAYATGSHVAFQSAPSLHTAAHEAAHVVQQRAGVQLLGGVGKAGDTYERHADQVADAVVSGQSAEGLLDAYAGGGGGGGGAVQHKIDHTKPDGTAVVIDDYAASGVEAERVAECVDNLGIADAKDIPWVQAKIAENGGKPSKKIRDFLFKWGSTHYNNDGYLPGTPGSAEYKEYYVRNDEGHISNNRRIVKGTGGTFYTNTHYGNHGDPAFYHHS